MGEEDTKTLMEWYNRCQKAVYDLNIKDDGSLDILCCAVMLELEGEGRDITHLKRYYTASMKKIDGSGPDFNMNGAIEL